MNLRLIMPERWLLSVLCLPEGQRTRARMREGLLENIEAWVLVFLRLSLRLGKRVRNDGERVLDCRLALHRRPALRDEQTSIPDRRPLVLLHQVMQMHSQRPDGFTQPISLIFLHHHRLLLSNNFCNTPPARTTLLRLYTNLP